MDQVYNELTQVWSLLNLHVRSSILEALPDFRTEINKKVKGSTYCMESKNRLPYDFLNKTLNLLFIEDNNEFKDFILDLFEPVHLYTISTASSNTEALKYLRSGLRFHACILDLGMNDIENDEFYILRQYAYHCPIVVLTGSSSPNKGATCIQLGARAVLEKELHLIAGSF